MATLPAFWQGMSLWSSSQREQSDSNGDESTNKQRHNCFWEEAIVQLCVVSSADMNTKRTKRDHFTMQNWGNSAPGTWLKELIIIRKCMYLSYINSRQISIYINVCTCMLYLFLGKRLKTCMHSFYWIVHSNWKSIVYDSCVTIRALYVRLIFGQYKLWSSLNFHYKLWI